MEVLITIIIILSPEHKGNASVLTQMKFNHGYHLKALSM